MAASLPPRLVLSDISAALFPAPQDGRSYELSVHVTDPSAWIYLASQADSGYEIPVVYDERQYEGTVTGLDWGTQVIRVVIV